MKTEVVDSDFQNDINLLGLLSGSEENLETFNEIYRKTLERLANKMIQCNDADTLQEHRQQLEMLKVLLTRQLDFFGLVYPPDTAKLFGFNNNKIN